MKKKEDGAAGGGFKKGGFKSAFGGGDVGGKTDGASGEGKGEVKVAVGVPGVEAKGSEVVRVEDAESDTEDEGFERYDPRRPTGCGTGCRAPT